MARAIDKDKLITSMAWHDQQGMISRIDDVLDIIEAFPTLTPPNEPRMINADKLAKRIAGHSNYHGDSILAAIYCAAEGKENDAPIRPIETTPNEWVSVYDRLPEPGERVLATDCGFVGEFYINKRGKWQRYNVNCSELLMALDILYWMPLPAPPDRCPPEGEA